MNGSNFKLLNGVSLFLFLGGRQIPGTPEWFVAATAKTKTEAKNVSRIALIAEEATRILAHS